MKMLIATDFLFERKESTLILDLLVSLYPKADLLTLSFVPGKILGEIEQRRIKSSFLSHLIKDEKTFHRYAFLIPEAIKQFKFEQNYDVVIMISHGFIHGLNLPPNTKKIVYLLDEKPNFKGIFSTYLNNYVLKINAKLENYYSPISTNEEFLLTAPIKTADFVINPNLEPLLDYYILATEGVDISLLSNVLKVLQELRVQVKVVGDEKRLEQLKAIYSSNLIEFWGKRCTGDLAILLQNARATIIPGFSSYPILGLCSLVMGRPILYSKTKGLEIYFKEEHGHNLDFYNQEEIKNKVLLMENDYRDYDSKILRRHALHYSERKFKTEISSIVEHH